MFIDLSKGKIHLRPVATKSRRAGVLDIPGDLLERLRLTGKGKGRIFETSPILRTFKADLVRAKIEYEVGSKQADRKCLRKTFCTHLALCGVDLWAAVKMMRHRELSIETWVARFVPKASPGMQGQATTLHQGTMKTANRPIWHPLLIPS